MRVTIRLGLPEPLRAEAAALYWQAFGGKLGRVMGPELRALRFLERVIRPDHVLVALAEDGRLLGLAGFKSPEGGFASGEPEDLRALYGRMGALWRVRLIQALEQEVDNDRFLLDGICVAREARGLGIGAALLAAFCAEGRRRGYMAARLDVVDTNGRARALYEREGFRVERIDDIGLLRFAFGFRRAYAMVKAL